MSEMNWFGIYSQETKTYPDSCERYVVTNQVGTCKLSSAGTIGVTCDRGAKQLRQHCEDILEALPSAMKSEI